MSGHLWAADDKGLVNGKFDSRTVTGIAAQPVCCTLVQVSERDTFRGLSHYCRIFTASCVSREGSSTDQLMRSGGVLRVASRQPRVCAHHCACEGRGQLATRSKG